jgi:RNA polymerase sigma factor (sigma-70 family)
MNQSEGHFNRIGLDHLDAKVQENRIRIRQLIAEKCEFAKKLPTRQRVMFLMYYDHGHTIEEIANLCNLTEGQVSRRLDGIAEKINNMSGDEEK